MGSPTVSNAKPVPMENTDKKSLKTLIKSLFHKKKERPKNVKEEQIQETKTTKKVEQTQENRTEKVEQKIQTKPQTDTVATILENFTKLDLQEKKKETQNGEDDELENFSFKVIEEHRNERIHSHSSEDSGFSEKTEISDKAESVDKSDELAEGLEKLELDDEEKKKPKRLQTVVITRTPIRTKYGGGYKLNSPYTRDIDPSRQISEVNKLTLTGGQVIVNQCQLQPDNLSEIDIACKTVQQKSQYLQNDGENYINDLLELIHEDTLKPSPKVQNDMPSPVMAERKVAAYDTERKTQDYFLADLEKKTIGQDEILQLLQENNYPVPEATQIDDIVNSTILEKEIFQYFPPGINNMTSDGFMTPGYTYPTPPRSENVPSPMSASPSSFYPSNSEYTLSPERSPIYNSDYEKYQYIPHFEEEKEATDKKARDRTSSISSMTMKQFKDMQKEIVYNFSKRECCQLSRKSCKELFQEHLQKLKMVERKDLCMKVVNLDLKTAYGVLHHIILSLSRGSDQEDLQYALFSLICERVLGQDIAMFTGDAGLSLLKAAALRCPHKPLLTRYLVQCIYTAIKTNASLAAGKDYVFHEVDALGDTLVIACARAGDSCSDVLSELVRAEPNQPPLFKLHHNNADGYTALHVACSQHSAASPRLHTVHVLLEHAGFELTEGDLKGRDTALHLAVNSANCDLQLILLMFKQVDRKEWKNLAHWPNLSTKTPIDLARLATKSSSRQNYPPEVLDFLKKCR